MPEKSVCLSLRVRRFVLSAGVFFIGAFALLLPLSLQAQPSAVAGSAHRIVRIGMLDFERETSYQTSQDNVQRAVSHYLVRMFPDDEIRTLRMTTQELKKAIVDGQVDFFLGSSGFYVSMQSYGVRDIATLVSSAFKDPNHAVSGTIFVRSDRTDLTDIASLQGKRVSSTHPNNFMTYQVNLGEIAREGYDPDRFFSEKQFTNNSPAGVIQSVLNGEADVGFLRSCMLEAITERHPEYAGVFRVIGNRAQNGACGFSTELYPGWTMGVVPHTNPDFTRRVTLALLAMPADEIRGGYTWAIATDFSGVNALFKRIKAGPYAYLRDWTVSRVIQEFWPGLLFLAGMFLTGIWHFMRVRALVEKRTEQLRLAIDRERESTRQAKTASERLDMMQRIASIGQISSIFVHEMGQPLSALAYGIHGIEVLNRRRLASGLDAQNEERLTECIKTLGVQLTRARDIIERVRDYARTKKGRESREDFCRIVREMVEEIVRSQRSAVPVELTLPDYPLIVEGNRLELSLIVINLVKNAQEAMSAAGTEGAVHVTLELGESPLTVVLTVQNPGAVIEHAVLKTLGTPFHTTKSEGLGLGLMLVTTMTEAHGGHIRFESPVSGGLTVNVFLNRFEDRQGLDITQLSQAEMGDVV